MKRQEGIPIFLILAFGVILAGINFFVGFAQDPDSYRIIKKAFEVGQRGVQPSRSLGFPLYEWPVYWIIFSAGRTAAKFYSLSWYLAAGCLLYATFRQWKIRPAKACLASLCYMVLPVAIISGNSILESSQGACLALASIFCFVHYLEGEGVKCRRFWLYAAALAAGCATATRLDYIFLAIAMALSLGIHRRASWKVIFLCGILTVSVPLGVYASLYGFSHMHEFIVIPDPWWRKIVRSFFGYLALFGIPGFILALYGIVKGWRSQQFDASFRFFFLLAMLLYLWRFTLLPDRLEYILIVPILTVLFLGRTAGMPFLVVLLIASLLPNFFQVHFFKRDPQTTHILVSPGLSPGAMWQDREGRRMQEYLYQNLDSLIARVAEHFGCHNYRDRISLLKDAAFHNQFDCLIVPNEMRRFLRKDRLFGRLWGIQSRLIVYDIPDHKGWRQFFAYSGWKEPHLEDFREVVAR